LHKEIFCRLDYIVVEIGSNFSEEVFDRLEDGHINLHFDIIEEITLNNCQLWTVQNNYIVEDLRYLKIYRAFGQLDGDEP
jgi:hypothetical protein